MRRCCARGSRSRRRVTAPDGSRPPSCSRCPTERRCAPRSHPPRHERPSIDAPANGSRRGPRLDRAAAPWNARRAPGRARSRRHSPVLGRRSCSRRSSRRPSGLAIAALEDWGFDAEVADAWPRAGSGERRRAQRRPQGPPRRASARHADRAVEDTRRTERRRGRAPALRPSDRRLGGARRRRSCSSRSSRTSWRGQRPRGAGRADTRRSSCRTRFGGTVTVPRSSGRRRRACTSPLPGLDAEWSQRHARGRGAPHRDRGMTEPRLDDRSSRRSGSTTRRLRTRPTASR